MKYEKICINKNNMLQWQYMSISQEPSSSVISEVAKNNFSSAIREVAKK